MKFITVRDIRTTPAQVWKQLPEEQEIVITNNGKPIALLTPITDDTLEQTLSVVRQARAIDAVRRMQQDARDRGLSDMSLSDINAVIDRTRAQRKR